MRICPLFAEVTFVHKSCLAQIIQTGLYHDCKVLSGSNLWFFDYKIISSLYDFFSRNIPKFNGEILTGLKLPYLEVEMWKTIQ